MINNNQNIAINNVATAASEQSTQSQNKVYTFEVDKIYHLSDYEDLKFAVIRENRDFDKRAQRWLNICKEVEMTSPATIVDATIVKAAGLAPMMLDKTTGKYVPVPDEILSLVKVLMDGHGRYAGYRLGLEESEKAGKKEPPFDFSFVYRKYEDHHLFLKQYISTNQDGQKTSSKEVSELFASSVKDPRFTKYLELCKDGWVAKAAQLRLFAHELATDTYKKVEAGHNVYVDTELVASLDEVYEKSFEKKFSGDSSKKILHGTPLAKWVVQILKEANDRKAAVSNIINQFGKMTTEVFQKIQDAKKQGDLKKEQVLFRLFNEVMEGKEE